MKSLGTVGYCTSGLWVQRDERVRGRRFVRLWPLSQVGTPAAWHQEFFQTTNATLQQGEEAQKGVEASVSLVNE